jgi:caa(3)-type oxidase subunit IV
MGSTDAGYSIYWKAWAILLALTVAMAFAPLGPAWIAAAILVKAGIIGAWFMHLRYERPALSVAIVVVTLATALVLFGLIAIDAVRP